jgi:hypothetical protein
VLSGRQFAEERSARMAARSSTRKYTATPERTSPPAPLIHAQIGMPREAGAAGAAAPSLAAPGESRIEARAVFPSSSVTERVTVR